VKSSGGLRYDWSLKGGLALDNKVKPVFFKIKSGTPNQNLRASVVQIVKIAEAVEVVQLIKESKILFAFPRVMGLFLCSEAPGLVRSSPAFSTKR
jgi:hypothetical protein